MNRLISFFLIIAALSPFSFAGQYREPVEPVKNVILMIADGTSLSVISASRWYQHYLDEKHQSLHIDPYLCGTVMTCCSNSPIGDSAPTTSCYMTGVPARAGNVAIYPEPDEKNDLSPLSAERKLQPLTTILEAVKYSQNKATGLVVTCTFPHATPADCAAHHHKRSSYSDIASQMAYNNLDVMFGGGINYLTDDIRSHFKKNGTLLIEDNANDFRSYDGSGKLWALFHQSAMPFDMDRDNQVTPSLAEMTKKALNILSRNENGFFLMVEGSKIDFAAHANDTACSIREFLAFDEAIKEAINFAKQNGNTAVVILSDHGTGGFTIGNSRSNKGYASKSLKELFAPIATINMSSSALSQKLLLTKPEALKDSFLEHTGITLKDHEVKQLYLSKNYKLKEQGNDETNDSTMQNNINNIINSRTFFSFTTTGHTGEEVFLAAYHPKNHIPKGLNTNIEINQYLFDVCGLQTTLDDITDEIFVKHTDLFQGMHMNINKDEAFPILTVTHNGNTLEVPAFKSIVKFNGKEIPLHSVVVYIDKNNCFYLPRSLKELLEQNT